MKVFILYFIPSVVQYTTSDTTNSDAFSYSLVSELLARTCITQSKPAVKAAKEDSTLSRSPWSG